MYFRVIVRGIVAFVLAIRRRTSTDIRIRFRVAFHHSWSAHALLFSSIGGYSVLRKIRRTAQ